MHALTLSIEVANGSQHVLFPAFNVPGVKEHAHFLKDIRDAREIRTRVIECKCAVHRDNILIRCVSSVQALSKLTNQQSRMKTAERFFTSVSSVCELFWLCRVSDVFCRRRPDGG